MLVVHPSSTCDVCLDQYSWDDSIYTPHSISCGHVFCLRCLQNLNVLTCPLCRRPFHLERARKLHVDLASDEPTFHQSSNDLEANQLEERVSDVCGEDASDDDCRAVIEEVLGWLDSRPLNAHRVLRESVSLLHRYKILKENFNSLRRERDELNLKLTQSEGERAQEKMLAKGMEDSWQTRLEELQRDHNKKLDTAEATTRQLESELINYTKYAKSYSKNHNPLPPPPIPIHESRLPAFARPRPQHSKSNGAPIGFIPESSALAAPPIPRRPTAPVPSTPVPMSRVSSPLPIVEESMDRRAEDVVVPPRPEYMYASRSGAQSQPTNNSYAVWTDLSNVTPRLDSNSHAKWSDLGLYNNTNRIHTQQSASASGSGSASTGLGLLVEESTPRRTETSLAGPQRAQSQAQAGIDMSREETETPRAPVPAPQRRATEPFGSFPMPTLNIHPLFRPQNMSIDSQESLASTLYVPRGSRDRDRVRDHGQDRDRESSGDNLPMSTWERDDDWLRRSIVSSLSSLAGLDNESIRSYLSTPTSLLAVSAPQDLQPQQPQQRNTEQRVLPNSSPNLSSFALVNPSNSTTAGLSSSVSRPRGAIRVEREEQRRQLLDLLIDESDTESLSGSRGGRETARSRQRLFSLSEMESGRQASTQARPSQSSLLRSSSQRIDNRPTRSGSRHGHAPIYEDDSNTTLQRQNSMSASSSVQRTDLTDGRRLSRTLTSTADITTPSFQYPASAQTQMRPTRPVDDRDTRPDPVTNASMSRSSEGFAPAPSRATSHTQSQSQAQAPPRSRQGYHSSNYGYSNGSTDSISMIPTTTYPGGYASPTALHSWSASHHSSSTARPRPSQG